MRSLRKRARVVLKKSLTPLERERRLRRLRTGDTLIYKNVGFGLVSYEDHTGDRVWRKRGRLYTSTFDSEGMIWNGETWEFDGGLGMKSLIVLPEDVPEGELAR